MHEDNLPLAAEEQAEKHPQATEAMANAANAAAKPKIGLALGGGGFKGAAHVGVLKVLAEHDIEVDYLAGTSIGSAVGALFASGYDWRKIALIFQNFDLDSLVKVRPSRAGLIPAEGYTELIRTCTKGKRIEELEKPLKIVAVDLNSWRKVVFDRGDTATAVRASSAVPGVFTPVKMGEMLLVDGFLLDNCPGGIVRKMGADIVIAVSLFAPSNKEPRNILEIITRSLDITSSGKQEIDADFILKPIQHFQDFLNSNMIDDCLRWGEEAALAQITQIKERIAAWQQPTAAQD